MPCHGTQEGNPLLLAAGKVLRTPVSFAEKPDALKEPVQFVLHEVPAGEPCGKADIFRYRQIRKDEGLLKDVPHLLRAETAFLLPCHLREIGSGNDDRALCRRHEPGEAVKKRRLPAPRRADERHGAAVFQSEGRDVERTDHAAVAVRKFAYEIPYFDQVGLLSSR